MARAVLVVLEQPDAAGDLLEGAACLARLIGRARISVLGIRMPPAATILPTEEVLTPPQERRLRAAEAERLAMLKARFDTWAAGAIRGAAVRWYDEEGLPAALVAEHGRRADFLVIARPMPGDHPAERQVVHAALFDTDRPVLVMPCGPAAPGELHAQFGRVVAIAWRDDRRA